MRKNSYLASREEDFGRVRDALGPELACSGERTLVAEGDSLALLRKIPNASVSLIITDPPYHATKKRNIFGDTQFDHDHEYVEWITQYAEQWRRVLRPNGSLYFFCASEMAASLPVTSDMDFIKAELCKYCCVLTCAAIDLCMEDCLIEYVENGRNQRVTRYVKRQVGRARNPTVGVICGILEAFDANWKVSLESYADQRVRSDIGSIVDNRNEIAHGRNSTVTFGRLIPWVKTAKAFCEEMEKIVFP